MPDSDYWRQKGYIPALNWRTIITPFRPIYTNQQWHYWYKYRNSTSKLYKWTTIFISQHNCSFLCKSSSTGWFNGRSWLVWVWTSAVEPSYLCHLSRQLQVDAKGRWIERAALSQYRTALLEQIRAADLCNTTFETSWISTKRVELSKQHFTKGSNKQCWINLESIYSKQYS